MACAACERRRAKLNKWLEVAKIRMGNAVESIIGDSKIPKSDGSGNNGPRKSNKFFNKTVDSE